MFKQFSEIVLLTIIVASCSSEKILIFHHLASYSHRVQTWPLAEALLAQGHEIQYISPFLPKKGNPNISELTPPKFEKWVDEFLNSEFDINLRVENSMDPIIVESFAFAYGACEALLTSEEFQNWISLEKNQKFDLVIVDNCLPACGIGLAHKLGAKYMIFSTVTIVAYEYDAYGFLPQSSAIPELEINPPPVPMGFFERFSNAILSLRWRWEHVQYLDRIDQLLREQLNNTGMPHIDELMRNVSLILHTGDEITDYPRSLPPLYVNIAGIHCRESVDPLPENIEAFINLNKTDEDNDGFIYISLGSLVVSSNLPDHIKQIFFDAIRAFPNIKFLWKWAGDFPQDIPENLFLEKWFPQIDILGHPKIRGFITQSGRPSSVEAMYFGVPMISFPILGDQDFNANRMSETGASIKLEIGTVTTDELKEALFKVLHDSSFRANAKKFQKILRDRPMSAVKTALWWTQYVLRNDDLSHLKPAGSNQNWFIRRQVDVWATLSIGAFIIISGIIGLTVKILNQSPFFGRKLLST